MQFYNEESECTDFEDPEEQLAEIQNNMHHIERKIGLCELDKKCDVENTNSEIKKNELEIKQLTLEIKELEVRMKMSQKADENVILKECRSQSRELGQLKGKSAKEAINLLDTQVLELDKKCIKFGHELQLLKRSFLDNEQQLREMASKCEEDFENEPTECDSLQRIRELENEQEKLNKNILECEVQQGKYKTIKEHLKKNQSDFPNLLLEVQKEYNCLVASGQHMSEANLEKDEDTNPSGELKAISDAGDGDDILFKEKDIKSALSSKDKSAIPEVSEQIKEMNELKDILEKIKEVTCVSDIKDAEGKFLAQKSIQEDLMDLKKRLTKSLQELRAQKKQLDIRMALIRGSNSDGSKSEENNTLRMSKYRHEEQERRREAAKSELVKLSSLLNEIEKRQAKVSDVLENLFPEAECLQKNLTSSDFMKKLEELLYDKFEVLGN